MNDISCMALFCDDIREEKGGTHTVVGVYPDNINIAKIPGNLAKLWVYIRIYIRPGFDPGKIVTRLLMPNGEEVAREEADGTIVENSVRRATEAGAPYAGIIARVVLYPFRIKQAGRIQAIVTAGGRDYIAGALNLRLSTAT